MDYYSRAITRDILQSLQHMPAVFINGPRQAGKSTLVQKIIAPQIAADYITFDDTSILAAASHDPEAFITSFSKPVIIDEVQLVPQLFRVLKKHIDKLRTNSAQSPNGRYLLTGSANILSLPQLADALVGRMSIKTLFPLSIGETLTQQEGFIPALFEEALSFTQNAFNRFNFNDLIMKATYPQLASDASLVQEQWFEDYLVTLLQRDVRALAEIEKLNALPHLLSLLAARIGGLNNDAASARDAGLNVMTYRRYRTLFNLLFLTIDVQPWYKNLSQRLVKSNKTYFTDTALLCHLLKLNSANLQLQNPTLFGKILENFVAAELNKQLSRLSGYRLYHFRTYSDKEVDFVIEQRGGKLIGIEVKSRSSVTADDFKGLKELQSLAGNDFVKGIVLYQGLDLLPFGEKLFAVPLAGLWELGAKPL